MKFFALIPFALVGCVSTPVKQVDVPTVKAKETVAAIVDVPVTKPEVIPVPAPKSEVKKPDLAGETTYYYTGKHKGVSAIYTQWKASKRMLLVYGETGQLTFTHEETRSSYLVYSEILELHPTGAIKTLKIVEQPDGGIQRYEAYISFNSVNTPLSKRVEKYPASLNDDLYSTYRWDSLNHDWWQPQTE